MEHEADVPREFRRWPMVVGALGGIAISTGIVVPETIHFAQEVTPATISIEVVLSNLFVASTAYLSNILGNMH